MASTATQIQVGLDAIASAIAANTTKFQQLVAGINELVANETDLATTYSSMGGDIAAGAAANPSNAAWQDWEAKWTLYVAEHTALLQKMQAAAAAGA